MSFVRLLLVFSTPVRSTGRAIAVTTASASALVKVFKTLYIISPGPLDGSSSYLP